MSIPQSNANLTIELHSNDTLVPKRICVTTDTGKGEITVAKTAKNFAIVVAMVLKTRDGLKCQLTMKGYENVASALRTKANSEPGSKAETAILNVLNNENATNFAWLLTPDASAHSFSRGTQWLAITVSGEKPNKVAALVDKTLAPHLAPTADSVATEADAQTRLETGLDQVARATNDLYEELGNRDGGREVFKVPEEAEDLKCLREPARGVLTRTLLAHAEARRKSKELKPLPFFCSVVHATMLNARIADLIDVLAEKWLPLPFGEMWIAHGTPEGQERAEALRYSYAWTLAQESPLYLNLASMEVSLRKYCEQAKARPGADTRNYVVPRLYVSYHLDDNKYSGWCFKDTALIDTYLSEERYGRASKQEVWSLKALTKQDRSDVASERANWLDRLFINAPRKSMPRVWREFTVEWVPAGSAATELNAQPRLTKSDGKPEPSSYPWKT